MLRSREDGCGGALQEPREVPFEVSDSTPADDRIMKLPLYAAT